MVEQFISAMPLMRNAVDSPCLQLVKCFLGVREEILSETHEMSMRTVSSAATSTDSFVILSSEGGGVPHVEK